VAKTGSRRFYPLDVAALGDGACQAEADHVQEQAGDAQQVHGVTDERRGDYVVHKEGPVVGKEHTPGGEQKTKAWVFKQAKAKVRRSCAQGG